MSESKQIRLVINCRLCHAENRSPKLEVGVTPSGLQVWCMRHQANVAHFTPEFLEDHIHNATCECCDREKK